MLTSPSGVIDEAQGLAAQAFGSLKTFFLVNGSTSGILASVMAVCKSGGPEDVILVARNCHLSAFSAFVLSGCTPRWIQPVVDEKFGVAHGITPSQLEESLREESEMASKSGRRIRAVMIVSPSYFGAISDIATLARICHQYDVPLIVDEAHGAHFTPVGEFTPVEDGANGSMPRSAISLGADISIQSTHKTLSAMTQAAMLHLGSQRVDEKRISNCLRTIQSSSPSYILMSSLDAARALFATPGFLLDQLRFASASRRDLAEVPGIDLMGPSDDFKHDPLRITVGVSRLGISGFKALEWLEEKHSVIAELATIKVVVFAMGPGTTRAHCQALVAAFKHLSVSFLQASTYASPYDSTPKKPETKATNICGLKLGKTPREAFFSSSERICLIESIGRLSAELLCPYPPGVPVLFPGEAITRDAIEALTEAMISGGNVTGASDGSLQTILVLTGDRT